MKKKTKKKKKKKTSDPVGEQQGGKKSPSPAVPAKRKKRQNTLGGRKGKIGGARKNGHSVLTVQAEKSQRRQLNARANSHLKRNSKKARSSPRTRKRGGIGY